MAKGDSRQTSEVESVSQPQTPAHLLDFRTIFELEVGYVMRTLRRLGVAPADVEDLAHDVFLAVHQTFHAYDATRALKPWLFGFAFRVASHYRRSAGRERPLDNAEGVVDAGDCPDVLVEKEARRRLVLAALEAIDLSRRAVFVLHELDAVTCDEIARTLEIPVGTVYSRLRLARQDFEAAVKRLRAQKVIE